MDSETHYLSYDPEEIWAAMMLAYSEKGGDVLYPGDEKEMLLRGVQAMIMQVFAGVDNALRMFNLRYAVRDYLDLCGERKFCTRIEAQPARCRVKMTFAADGVEREIEAGSAMTADGQKLYLLDSTVYVTGAGQEVEASIICRDAGKAGNGLTAGTQMQLTLSCPAVIGIYTTEDASGGVDREDDESYRERIRNYGLASTTAGPAQMYENLAMSVSTQIVDAKALTLGAGVVGVYLVMEEDAGSEALLAEVTAKLNAEDVRPLTDTVQVLAAEVIPYGLNVQVTAGEGENLNKAAQAAMEEYRKWQDRQIGLAFNPDKLMAMLYQAGAARVTWAEGSHMNGGAVEYTPIPENACLAGEITLEVVTA